MSVQFGRWNVNGKAIDQDYLKRVKACIAAYGPDDARVYASSNLAILFHAFHTTKESRRELQPQVTQFGLIITWDGRLDNRVDLILQLGNGLTLDSTDLSIVVAAYEKFGTDCFAKFIGDWAISIVDLKERALILAKDPIGTRPLYYSMTTDRVTWSTILDPLVLFADKSFALSEEYIAGWLSFFPATHLTPYVGIHAVPPCFFALVRDGRCSVRRYWDFNPRRQVRYATNAEYEEHFRLAFEESVRRRLRCDTPIVAELSGGMDSSAIVCMADHIIARGATEAPRLDTISYYDQSEPNWDERPYFTKVEEKRGRKGTHIDMGNQGLFWLEFDPYRFDASPGSCNCILSEPDRRIEASLDAHGNRVVLSGTGGDEVTGGVPTPDLELQDLLARGEFTSLAHQLKAWALNKRKPWFHLLLGAAREFLPPIVFPVARHKVPPPWLDPSFVKRNRIALTGYERRVRFFGTLPSFQGNLSTLDAVRRQLTCLSPNVGREKRYPYLDRDLLEFIYSIPREQLVRPGQRRSLMRRALAGIVPAELLNRKRKAFVVRGPSSSIAKEWSRLQELGRQMLLSSVGIVDSTRFMKVLQMARQGAEVPIVGVMRALRIEIWLRTIAGRHILDGITQSQEPASLCTNKANYIKRIHRDLS